MLRTFQKVLLFFGRMENLFDVAGYFTIFVVFTFYLALILGLFVMKGKRFNGSKDLF
jgi:hypothetical protein